MERYLWVTILILIATLFIQRECSRPSDVEIIPPEPEVIVEHVYDTIQTVQHLSVPIPVQIIDTVEILIDVDTAAILSDYHKIRLYHDTLVDTDDLFFVVKDTVHQNRLWNRKISYMNKRPDSTMISFSWYPIPEKSRRKWFAGGTILGSPDQFGFGVGLGLKTRNDGLYTYNYDIVNNTHNLSMYWRLKFW